jgi:NAD(P)H-dependent flavin oxidoreductase YrpB (nitropropane dioxygenase family)
MKTRICGLVGVDFPLFAFTHHREVVAAVSKAGGFGVLGVVGFTPEELKVELDWIDAHVEGKPYGIDMAIPENMAVKTEQGLTSHALRARIPEEYWRFTNDFLKRFDIDHTMSVPSDADQEIGFMPDTAERAMDVVFQHPVRLVVQALGRVPLSMIDRGRKHGVPIGALVGSAEHARRQVDIGVEVLVPQGYESGGHGAELSTMVLVPEVVRAVDPAKASVLAAGGIVTGRQMAAAMAMGADGAWTGSVWLATKESGLSPTAREKLVEARSRDTLKTRAGSGKMSRQTRSAWTEAWEAEGALAPLPMPFQGQLTTYVMQRAERSVAAGNVKARQVLNQIVGQGVGMMDEVKTAGDVVREFMDDFQSTLERMRMLAI